MYRLRFVLLLALPGVVWAEPWGSLAAPRVSLAVVQIAPSLLGALAGADEALLRRRLEGEMRLAGVRLGGEADQGAIRLEVRIQGDYARRSLVAYWVDVVLKPSANGAWAAAHRTVEGLASPTALWIQVLVASAEQVGHLLRTAGADQTAKTPGGFGQAEDSRWWPHRTGEACACPTCARSSRRRQD